MPITPTNQTKNVINPSGNTKGYAKQAVYGVGVYGLAIYGIGVAGFGAVTNAIKTLGGGLWVASVLPWQLSTPWQTVSAALSWVNKSKN